MSAAIGDGSLTGTSLLVSISTDLYLTIYRIPNPYTMLLYKGIDSGSASSLPSLVLRSMLKQRRILMRMH